MKENDTVNQYQMYCDRKYNIYFYGAIFNDIVSINEISFCASVVFRLDMMKCK